MTQKRKVELKDIGLDIGLAFARHVYKTDYLHYGYWPEGLSVEPANVLEAQTNYAKLLINNIPKGVKNILEVGCGSGKFMEQLLEAGFTVEGVSPNPQLSAIVREKLGSKTVLHECRYEDLQTSSQFDMIIFSESFQYLLLEKALIQSCRFLNPGGFMLICDFFKRDKPPEGEAAFGPNEKSPISGGHGIDRFLKYMEQQPFQQTLALDISRETAPSLDIMRDLIGELMLPTWNSVAYYMKSNYPWFSVCFSKIFQYKIKQAYRKYLSGKTNGSQFYRFKTYRLLLYQMNCQK